MPHLINLSRGPKQSASHSDTGIVCDTWSMRIIDASHAQTHSREKGHAAEKKIVAEREERQVVLSLAGEAISFRWAANADAWTSSVSVNESHRWARCPRGWVFDNSGNGPKCREGCIFHFSRESTLDARELTSCSIRRAPQLCPGKMPVLRRCEKWNGKDTHCVISI